MEGTVVERGLAEGEIVEGGIEGGADGQAGKGEEIPGT